VSAIFAINIASAALIGQLIQNITEKTGHTMEKSRNVVISELKIQAVMLVLCIVFIVLYKTAIPQTSSFYEWSLRLKYCSQISLLSIYFYFIWLTYDLGRSLFQVLKVKIPKSGELDK
jgi:hypothetical protein